jgi:hypothetical protein
MRYEILAAAISAVSALVIAATARKKKRWAVISTILRRRLIQPPRMGPLRPALAIVPVRSRHPSDFLLNFRFMREQFACVLEAYGFPDSILTRRCIRVDAWCALGIVLRRLALPGPWTVHEEFFGRRTRSLNDIFGQVVTFIFKKCQLRLQRPSRSFLTFERLMTYAEAIHAKGGLYQRVVGFIDGTVYQICRPSGDPEWQRSLYSGHKKYHGFKWQGINTPDGLIQFLHGPFCGPQHDTTILTESGLVEYMRAAFKLPPAAVIGSETHFSVFGDPGGLLML